MHILLITNYMFEKIALRFQKFAPLFLRGGLGSVFFLFGLQKLLNPGQTTAEIQLLLNFELVDAAATNFYLGLVELLLATALLIGLKVRIFGLIGALLTMIFLSSFLFKYGLSINPDLYRDVGLFGGALALFLLGGGPFALDNLLKHKENNGKIS